MTATNANESTSVLMWRTVDKDKRPQLGTLPQGHTDTYAPAHIHECMNPYKTQCHIHNNNNEKTWK